MRAVDANVLVRLLTRDDRKQFDVAAAFVAAGAWVSHLVLVEAVQVMESVYDVRPAEVLTGIELLLDHERIVVQEPAVVRKALELFRAQPRVDFSDCMIVSIAESAGHQPLGTFDRGLATLSGVVRL